MTLVLETYRYTFPFGNSRTLSLRRLIWLSVVIFVRVLFVTASPTTAFGRGMIEHLQQKSIFLELANELDGIMFSLSSQTQDSA